MAKSGIVFGREAVRQLGEMRQWWYRNYRNAPPPTRRQPVIHGGETDEFWAVIFDKTEFEIDWELDPLFYGVCRGPDFPMYRGEFSWFEIVEGISIDHPGYFRLLEQGRFGIAGQCDAAHEVNRANVNIHLNMMIVRMYVGGSEELQCESSDEVSSGLDYLDSTDIPMTSTNLRYWFDLGLPREDCARPYIIAAAPGNDFPPPP